MFPPGVLLFAHLNMPFPGCLHSCPSTCLLQAALAWHTCIQQRRPWAAPALLPPRRCGVRQPPPPQRRRGVPQPPRSFMSSLDVPSLVPGWLMPSWLSPEPGSPRDAVRRARLKQLLEMLTASRREPALALPLPPDEALAAGGGADDAGGGPLDVSHSASNAVPFHSPTGGAAAPGALGGLGGGAAGCACRAEQAWQVLPWLYCAEGRMDFAAMESLASQLALSGLQLLDVSRYVAASTSSAGHWHNGWGGHIRWAGPQALPSPVVAAAAALRRMELRRGGALSQLPDIEGKVVSGGCRPLHRTPRYTLPRKAAASGVLAAAWEALACLLSPRSTAHPNVCSARVPFSNAPARPLPLWPPSPPLQVVLAFHPQHRQLAAETLALYLHAYMGVSGREAVQAAGHAVGTSPLESTLRQSLEELAVIADGWYRRVTLAWPYGGGHVEIVGEAGVWWARQGAAGGGWVAVQGSPGFCHRGAGRCC